ncbi:hypothetical protein [Dactylosporangium darangshiense]
MSQLSPELWNRLLAAYRADPRGLMLRRLTQDAFTLVKGKHASPADLDALAQRCVEAVASVPAYNVLQAVAPVAKLDHADIDAFLGYYRAHLSRSGRAEVDVRDELRTMLRHITNGVWDKAGQRYRRHRAEQVAERRRGHELELRQLEAQVVALRTAIELDDHELRILDEKGSA